MTERKFTIAEAEALFWAGEAAGLCGGAQTEGHGEHLGRLLEAVLHHSHEPSASDLLLMEAEGYASEMMLEHKFDDDDPLARSKVQWSMRVLHRVLTGIDACVRCAETNDEGDAGRYDDEGSWSCRDCVNEELGKRMVAEAISVVRDAELAAMSSEEREKAIKDELPFE